MYYVNGEILFTPKTYDFEGVHNLFRKINPNADTEDIITEIKNAKETSDLICDIERIKGHPPITEETISTGIELIKEGKYEEAMQYGKGQIEVSPQTGKVFLYTKEKRYLYSLKKLDQIIYISYTPVFNVIDKKEIEKIVYEEPYIYVYDKTGYKTIFICNLFKREIRLWNRGK